MTNISELLVGTPPYNCSDTTVFRPSIKLSKRTRKSALATADGAEWAILSIRRCLYNTRGRSWIWPVTEQMRQRGDPAAPDEVLVVAAILGDLSSFDELVRRYRAAVVRTAGRIVGRDDADDVAQESLLLAFKALPSIEDPARFAAWLAVITRHHAVRFAKRQQTRTASSVELDEMLLEHISSLSMPAAVDKESEADLREALAELPADYAAALSLRFLDEMSLKRISAFLGVPVSTVKWRLHRGKQLLREKLEPATGTLNMAEVGARK